MFLGNNYRRDYRISVYLRIRSASPPLKRKFRQLSQCFVICRVKKWVCKRAVWISPVLWRHRAGDLNIPALAPGISAHTSSATWTRIRHCVALASLVHDSLTATMYNPKAKHSCSVVRCTDPHVSLHRLPTKEINMGLRFSIVTSIAKLNPSYCNYYAVQYCTAVNASRGFAEHYHVNTRGRRTGLLSVTTWGRRPISP